MGIRDKAWDLIKGRVMKERLGYTDEEMKLFRDNHRNENVISKAPDLLNKTIDAEVVAAHGCNSQHRIGDKLYFDGARDLPTKRCPKKICVYALSASASMIFTAGELFLAGFDPNDTRFR